MLEWFACVLFCLLCTASRQMGLQGPGGGGIVPAKMFWGVLPKFQI